MLDDTKSPWEQAYDEEHVRIRERRRVAFGFPRNGYQANGDAQQEPVKDLFGLALSGGGIRSALFNEGFLQALSHRGLLRFVDYLSSVSGGGYIAGHLIASGLLKKSISEQNAVDGSESFHDDPDCYHLGKDPESGQLEPNRLEDAGNYLAKKSEFLASYAASEALTVAFYIGLVGALATIAALAWRSLDHSLYRRAVGLLGFDWGGELFEAYMPFLVLLLFWLASATIRAILLLAFRWLPPNSSRSWPAQLNAAWRACNKGLAIAVAACALVGLAVFLGNGWTRVRQGGDLHLNNFATWFVVAAIVSQVAVFMGRNRLFKSEKSESPHWQQVAQQFVAYACVGLAVFAMIHWMSREDISHYTKKRDPHLVRGDVLSWRDLTTIGKQFGMLGYPESVLAAMQHSDREAIKYHGRDASGWRTYQVYRPVLIAQPSASAPPSPFEEPPGGRVDALKSVSSQGQQILPANHPTIRSRLADLLRITVVEFFTGPFVAGSDPGQFEENTLGRYPSDLQQPLVVVRREWRAKDRFLRELNLRLQDQATSLQLLHRVKATHREKAEDSITSPVNASNTQASNATDVKQLEKLWAQNRDYFPEWIAKHAEGRAEWGSRRVDACLRDTEWILARATATGELQAEERDPQDYYKATEQQRIVKFNLNMLDLLYPGMLNDPAIASTPVVIHHDQRHRLRWLALWVVLFVIGYVGTLDLNHQMPLYRYYRRMLGEKFLTGWVGRPAAGWATVDASFAEKPLFECDPTSVGLPYPLILGSLLRSDFKRDGNVEPSPFLFTPKYVGITDPREAFVAETRFFKLPFHSAPIALVDAITISGSAVAPLMTQNKALRILLDFFNVRLGQWVRKPEVAGAKPARGLDWLGFLGYLTMFRETRRPNSEWRHGFVADGGFVDYLGVHELLRRKCRLIVATDAGSNLGNNKLQTLARLLETAQVQLGVKFIDLDHEAPIDFGRLLRNDDRVVPQPFLCMRIRYPKSAASVGAGPEETTGYFIYAQMAITDRDPLEVRQIRDRFPNFPDEPTQNQFYTEEQVSAYRQLGYYIGSRVCSELARWNTTEIQRAVAFRDVSKKQKEKDQPLYFGEPVENTHLLVPPEFTSGAEQPLMPTIRRRLLASFRMACYEEISYQKNDVFSEAVWDRREWCFPSLRDCAVGFVKFVLKDYEDEDWTPTRIADKTHQVCDYWIRAYEDNADVRGAYRRAALMDMDSALVSLFRGKAFAGLQLHEFLLTQMHSGGAAASEAVAEQRGPMRLDFRERMVMAAHLSVLAVACQQLHRGTSHAIFQIGGRDKLIDLVISIVSDDRSQGELFDPKVWLRKASPEIIEMRRCVFVSAQIETVVSFAYLLTMHVIGVGGSTYKGLPKAQRKREMLRSIRMDKVEKLPRQFEIMLEDAANGSE